jgi:ABC-2 type transport system permease protein
MKTAALARATLRGTTWISTDGLRELARRDQLWVLPLAALGVLVGLGVVEFMIVGTYRSFLQAGISLGHPELLFFYALLGSWAFLFITAIPLALSVLYYSSDLRMLLTLPVRPSSIVGAKLLLLYLYCLPVNLVLFVPALWLSVAALGAPASLVISGLVSLIISPLLPLSLATLLVLLLMKLVNLSRFRVALEVAGMALGVVLVIGMQVVLSRTTIAAVSGGSSVGTAGLAGMYDALTRALPPIAWAARGFAAGSGPVPVLLSLALTAACFAAAMLLAPVNFMRDVMERREAGLKRKDRKGGSAALIRTESEPRGVVRGLVGREWAILSSNSTFIFEAVGELLILPLLLGIYGLIIPKQFLGTAVTAISTSPVLGLAAMGVLVLMTSLTTVSSTSLSREGARMALSLTMPVPGRVQLQAKLYFHLLFFASAYLADLAIVWVLFRFPLVSLLYMIPGGLALQVLGFATSIFFDLKRPFLKWTHPQQAMKNNINAMTGIGGTVGIVALIAAPTALGVLAGVNTLLLGFGVAVVAVILVLLLLPRLFTFADRQYGGGMELES